MLEPLLPVPIMKIGAITFIVFISSPARTDCNACLILLISNILYSIRMATVLHVESKQYLSRGSSDRMNIIKFS